MGLRPRHPSSRASAGPPPRTQVPGGTAARLTRHGVGAVGVRVLSSSRWLAALLTVALGGVAYAVVGAPSEPVPALEPDPPAEVALPVAETPRAAPPSLAALGNAAEANK